MDSPLQKSERARLTLVVVQASELLATIEVPD
jgi:hypothetical protein